ncbi:hypothetical protein ASPVEDRAFT_475278 [Aspergillus versicolor CBS 583.65]|uniref:Uncharacterized protein n=1 Tax=Aspergillus versicolor CBS 583.65 TaxID=1036611 RepID=A0A1L9PAW7_ASPVE|nr:uncharacterized protein ASPVEDRAFT_475278 [Aspergillus versicolor CBS 583.65]OJI98594.1 hypothetical protein ASPVEDRAFT_475278 [Aspergillus versicolor CBS 583.65]
MLRSKLGGVAGLSRQRIEWQFALSHWGESCETPPHARCRGSEFRNACGGGVVCGEICPWSWSVHVLTSEPVRWPARGGPRQSIIIIIIIITSRETRLGLARITQCKNYMKICSLNAMRKS